MHARWIGPGERAWLLRPRGWDRRQQLTHRFERGVRPQLLACRAEYCQRQSPARLHRAPYIRKGGHWIAKKHDSKARERQVEAVRRERMGRSVGDDDLRVLQAGSSDPSTRSGDRLLGDICAKDMTARADMLRQLKNCRAGAAPHIEYVLAGLRRRQIQQ